MNNIIDPNKPLTKKVEVKCYMTMVYCRHCGAPLQASNTVLTTHPAQYQYFCPNCKQDSLTSYERYPKISYEEVEIARNPEDPS